MMFVRVLVMRRRLCFFGCHSAFPAHANAVKEDQASPEINLLKKKSRDQK